MVCHVKGVADAGMSRVALSSWVWRRVVAWLLLLAGLVGVLFMKVIHVEDPRRARSVLAVVLSLATMALPALGFMLFQDLGKLRKDVPAAVRTILRQP